MISKKSLLITAISLIGAALLAIWLYITFHILFIFLFIPLVFVGPFLGKKSVNKGKFWEEDYSEEDYYNEKPFEGSKSEINRRSLIQDKKPELPEDTDTNK